MLLQRRIFSNQLKYFQSCGSNRWWKELPSWQLWVIFYVFQMCTILKLQFQFSKLLIKNNYSTVTLLCLRCSTQHCSWCWSLFIPFLKHYWLLNFGWKVLCGSGATITTEGNRHVIPKLQKLGESFQVFISSQSSAFCRLQKTSNASSVLRTTLHVQMIMQGFECYKF